VTSTLGSGFLGMTTGGVQSSADVAVPIGSDSCLSPHTRRDGDPETG
jgi:hypothetical protein